MNKFNYVLLTLITLGLMACGSGGSGGGGGGGGGGIVKADPDDAMTTEVSFSGGELKNGAPPAPTNQPGDAYLTAPSSTATTVDPGASSTLTIGLNNVPAGQPFNVNVRFGSSNKYITIPMSDTVVTQVANAGGSGTLSLPFTVPSGICNNLDDIQHQIDCYESVDIGGGVQVSKETARQMILACQSASSGNDDWATGPSDYCAENYPQEACALLNDQSGADTRFTQNQTCSSAFPNSTYLMDYGCSSDGYSSSCGACGVQISYAKPAKTVNKSVNVEAEIYKQFEAYQNDPEARKRITFTPNK